MSCKRDIILTFDDREESQFRIAVPLLRRYGFHATFFVQKNGSMTDEQLRQTAATDGFEIGNHTFGHFFPEGKTDIQEWQYREMESALAELGIEPPETFGYPGGPYTESGAEILKRNGKYIAARTNERRLFHPETDDPFRIPAFAVADKYPGTFEQVMALWEQDPSGVPVLIWHGIPGPYPECATQPDAFRRQMEFLAEMHCRTWTLGEYIRSRAETVPG